MANLSGRDVLVSYAAATIFLAAFPRFAYWPARSGPRGLLAYVAFNAAARFALRAWLLPYVRQIGEEQEQAKEQLRQRLGREPNMREVFEHLGIAWTD